MMIRSIRVHPRLCAKRRGATISEAPRVSHSDGRKSTQTPTHAFLSVSVCANYRFIDLHAHDMCRYKRIYVHTYVSGGSLLALSFRSHMFTSAPLRGFDHGFRVCSKASWRSSNLSRRCCFSAGTSTTCRMCCSVAGKLGGSCYCLVSSWCAGCHHPFT